MQYAFAVFGCFAFVFFMAYLIETICVVYLGSSTTNPDPKPSRREWRA